MQLCIHTHGIDLTDAIKKQTYQKLELALDRLEGQICDVSVTIFDNNGPFWVASTRHAGSRSIFEIKIR